MTVTTDTGIPYIAFGAGQSSGVFIPNDPVRLVVPSFWLVVVGSDRALPPNPILPVRSFRPVLYNRSGSRCNSIWYSPLVACSISMPGPCRSPKSPGPAIDPRQFRSVQPAYELRMAKNVSFMLVVGWIRPTTSSFALL